MTTQAAEISSLVANQRTALDGLRLKSLLTEDYKTSLSASNNKSQVLGMFIK